MVFALAGGFASDFWLGHAVQKEYCDIMDDVEVKFSTLLVHQKCQRLLLLKKNNLQMPAKLLERLLRGVDPFDQVGF